MPEKKFTWTYQKVSSLKKDVLGLAIHSLTRSDISTEEYKEFLTSVFVIRDYCTKILKGGLPNEFED